MDKEKVIHDLTMACVNYGLSIMKADEDSSIVDTAKFAVEAFQKAHSIIEASIEERISTPSDTVSING